MPAKFITNVEPGWPRLGHRVRVEKPVQGRALIDADDPLAAEIRAWMEDPQNEADGLWGLINVEPIDGDALSNGVRYWYGFIDTPTAERFRERWGKMAEPA